MAEEVNDDQDRDYQPERESESEKQETDAENESMAEEVDDDQDRDYQPERESEKQEIDTENESMAEGVDDDQDRDYQPESKSETEKQETCTEDESMAEGVDDDQDRDYQPESESESEKQETCTKNESMAEGVDDDQDRDYQPESESETGEIIPDSDEEQNADKEIDSIPSFVKFIREEMIDDNDNGSETKPYQRKVSECDKIRDKKYRNIYIKKYDKSFEGKSGHKKKTCRPYDTVHACVFCRKLFTHIQDPIEKNHRDKEMVVEIQKLKEKKSAEDKQPYQNQIKKLQDCLRFEGDHFHNLSVKESKEGELLVMRKSVQENLDVCLNFVYGV